MLLAEIDIGVAGISGVHEERIADDLLVAPDDIFLILDVILGQQFLNLL